MAEMLGPYLLARRIGSGGMADVILARGPRGVCVIKRPHANLVGNPEFLRMFLDEAALVAQLNHPGIAQVFDLGQINGTFYLAMEYVPGFDLMTLSLEHERQGEFIAPELCAKLVADAAAALHHAHEAVGRSGKPLNLIHRDVTPHNILLSTSGEVKLIDFGVARAASTMHKTQAGFVKGKYPYMSPEQVTGGTIDRRVDVFALGLVLYELLTNTRAIQGEYEWEQIENARQGRIRPVEQLRPNTPQRLREILKRCFALKPDDRYPTAAALEGELLDWLHGERFDLGPEDLLRLFRVIAAEAVNSAEEVPSFSGRPLTKPPAAVPTPSANDTLIPGRPTEPSIPGAAVMNTDGDDRGTGRSSTPVRPAAAGLPGANRARPVDQLETLPPDDVPFAITMPSGVKVGGAARPLSVLKPPLSAGAEGGSRRGPEAPLDAQGARTGATDLFVTERLEPVVLAAANFKPSKAWPLSTLAGFALVLVVAALWWLQRQPKPLPAAVVPAVTQSPAPEPSPLTVKVLGPATAALEVPANRGADVGSADAGDSDASSSDAGPRPSGAPLGLETVPIRVQARVESNVIVDGVRQGTTPWSSTIAVGLHSIGVDTPGHLFHDDARVVVEAGQPVALFFKGLARKSPPAPEREVILEVGNALAQITIDGRRVTSEFISQASVRLKEGRHLAVFELMTEEGAPKRIEKRAVEVREDTVRLQFDF